MVAEYRAFLRGIRGPVAERNARILWVYKSRRELTMQIGETMPLANGGGAQYTLNAGVPPGQTDQDGAQAVTAATSVTAVPSQDEAVQISPQGQAAASNDNADNPGAEATTESSTAANAQPLKSLVYGALGLDRPDEPADPNHAYTVGQWIAAGITLGGIVSLFI
jgi:hypothetical protein